MLRELFLHALNLSLLGLPLMVVILLLRRLLGSGVPRRAVYMVWLLVFLRLMLPVTLSSPVSFYRLLPEKTLSQGSQSVPVSVISDRGATVDFPVLVRPWEDNPDIDGGVRPSEQVEPPVVTRRPTDLYTILATVWACGAAMLCGFGTFCYLLVLHKVRRESFLIDLPASSDSTRARIYRSELFHTPVVCGLLRPKIILPMEMDTDDLTSLHAVVSHERAHIRRMDNLWRLLASLTLYLHWFNPLAWVCYCAFIRDMEVSCDEQVLAASREDIRFQYASTLLTLATTQGNPLYGGILSFGESGIQERVKHIMSFQRAKLFAVILCAAVTVGLGIVFLTNPSQVEAAQPPVASSSSQFVPSMSADASVSNEALPAPAPDQAVSTGSSQTSAPTPGASIPADAALAPTVQTVKTAQSAQTSVQGYDIKYDNSEVTYVYILDAKNSSYRLIENSVDRVNLVLAAVARTTTSGSGQVLIHTKDAKHALDFDPAQDTKLAALCDELSAKSPNIAQWLAWMTDPNLMQVRYGYSDTEMTFTDQKSLDQIADSLKRLEVKPAPWVVPEGINPLTARGLYDLTLRFENGTTFTIDGYNAQGMTITTSDTGRLAIVYRCEQEDGMQALFALMEKLAKEQQKADLPAHVAQILCASDDVLRVNLYHNTDKTYVELEGPYWNAQRQMLSGAKKATLSELGAPLAAVNTMEVTRKSDLAKFTYRLYENGFTVEGTAVENKSVEAAYTLESPALWSMFCTDVQRNFNAFVAPGAYWLGLMSDAKIKEVYMGDNASHQWMQGRTQEEWEPVVKLLRGITVKTPFTQFDPAAKQKSVPDSVSITVDFNNDIHYDVTVTKTQLEIISSDMSYGLRYQLAGDCWLEDLRAYADVPNPTTGKPVIYLYPKKTTDVKVTLDFDGALTYTYPAYNSGWEVTAQPDGTLTNKADGSTHYYLFWEGKANDEWEHERGFVVSGAKTEQFLREKLAYLGLTPREYNDFITYWVPKMQENRYNLISFSGDQYGEIAKLTVTPKPDSMLRVHMVWKALEKPVTIEPQALTPFERTGFAVVEWGGTEVR